MPPHPQQTDAKLAVESGYWPLYRYQPGEREGEGRLHLDSKRIKGNLEEFLQHENRWAAQRSELAGGRLLSHDRCMSPLPQRALPRLRCPVRPPVPRRRLFSTLDPPLPAGSRC